MRELNLSIAKSDSEMNDPEFLEYADSSFVKGVLNLIEVLVAIDKREQAIEVQSQALSYFPHADIEQAIQ
ncbi:MAG: hypothetical protein N0E42_12255 [Candidatus Thiodiazotropha endolucinida]|nr:hypothetical protein [Candidatus Thiodiazotropha endolucinida]